MTRASSTSSCRDDRQPSPRLLPPAQTPLIAADLEALGVSAPPCEGGDFFLPDDAYLGVVWALAGSSLGNRAMLARRCRAGLAVADSFLSDPAMPAFWRAILPELERPVGLSVSDAACNGAKAVFARFLSCADLRALSLAA